MRYGIGGRCRPSAEGIARIARMESEMSDDLVKRLLNEATRRQGLERFDTLEDEAADHIEALTAEALDWRAQVGELSDKVKALTAERDALREEVEALTYEIMEMGERNE